MIRRTSTLLSVILSLIAPAAAWANHPVPQDAAAAGDRAVPSFHDLDKNGDGKLTRSEIPHDVEALKQLRAHFREADLNQNGSLSSEEYVKYTTAYKPSGI